MIAIALDAILVLVVVEGVALTLLRRRLGSGLSPAALWPNLAAGFLLMLAVRLALAAGPPSAALQAAIAAVLGLALIAHVVDLAMRWRVFKPRD